METRVKLIVKELIDSQIRSGAYTLVLAEETGQHRIPIIIGTAEAQSITFALQHIMPPRPITHDLFVSFIQSFNIRLGEVFIYKFEEGIYYSKLLFNDGSRIIQLDSRTSDAIAIALRIGCDIYTTPDIMHECGISFDNSGEFDESGEEFPFDFEPEDIKDEIQLKMWLAVLEKKELETRLNEAIENENYEHAKMYQDELKRRKGNGE